MTDPNKPNPADDARGAFVARASLHKHHSHVVTDGLERAPHRGLFPLVEGGIGGTEHYMDP